LGINAHDAGLYDRPLEPGVVLTVEPGIYIPNEAMGIRIEDDVLITADGAHIMSDKLGRELA
jgi:Xaa-Pro aminopeptidase